VFWNVLLLGAMVVAACEVKRGRRQTKEEVPGIPRKYPKDDSFVERADIRRYNQVNGYTKVIET
jgi:hypothetical protein